MQYLLEFIFGRWESVMSAPAEMEGWSPLFGTRWTEKGILAIERNTYSGRERAFYESDDAVRKEMSLENTRNYLRHRCPSSKS